MLAMGRPHWGRWPSGEGPGKSAGSGHGKAAALSGTRFPFCHTGTRRDLLLGVAGRAECGPLAKQLNSDKAPPGRRKVLC